MIKILHTADIHIGVENYGRVDSRTGLHSRLLDFARVFEFSVDKAIQEKVDLFIIAGDSYKTANPTPTHQKLLLHGLLRLQKEGIAVAIVVGNHDHPMSYGKAHALDVYSDLPIDGFYVFDKPKGVTINTKNGPLQVVGIPWPSRQNLIVKDGFKDKDFSFITEYISQSVTEIIKKLANELDPSIPAVLTSHLTVANGVFSGSEKRAVFGNDPLFLANNLAIEPFNYVALGHLHRHQSLNLKGQIPVVYAGSLERIDFGEVRDTKGFVIAKVATKRVSDGKFERICEQEFIPTPTRRMEELNIYLKNDGEAFTKQIIDEIKKHDFNQSIAKLFYHIPQGSFDTVDIPLVYRNLESAWFISGIIPIHQFVKNTNSRSISLKEEYSTKDLLEKYFSYKKIESKRKEHLLARAEQMLIDSEKKDCCE